MKGAAADYAGDPPCQGFRDLGYGSLRMQRIESGTGSSGLDGPQHALVGLLHEPCFVLDVCPLHLLVWPEVFPTFEHLASSGLECGLGHTDDHGGKGRGDERAGCSDNGSEITRPGKSGCRIAGEVKGMTLSRDHAVAIPLRDELYSSRSVPLGTFHIHE